MPEVLLLALLAAAPVSQDTGYEDRLIAWGVALHSRELEPAPEGKRIEEVLIASEDVFAPSDPYPLFLNLIHVRTREPVIRREVLLAAGDLWDSHRVMETERNLRRLFLLAVVKVVAVKGRDGGVALLVVSKDRWSLRLSNSFTLIGSLLQFLQLQLIEVNFNGWGQQLAVNTTIRLDTFTVGQTFIERRLLSSRWYFGESAALIFNRQTGALEGTTGAVAFGRPIITLDQEWGFLLDTSWNSRRRRVFRGASIWQLPYPDASSGQTVPLVYDVREFAGEATLTRSFGRALKVDLSGSLGGYSRQYRPSLVEGEQADWLIANYLPRSENVTYVTAYARAFPADYRVLRNIDTFEISEDFQLGWVAQGGVRWAFPLPFAPSSFVELGASLRYRFYKADDLFTVTVAGAMRVRPGQELANRRFAAELSNYSPQFWGGRLVTRVLVDFKGNDLDNRQLLLGGSTGLRGAYPEQFTGRNLVLANVEYRARPLELWSNWLGIVLFYDVGSAFDTVVLPTHTVGIGFRLLLPQLNKEVLRIDFGFVFGGSIPGADRINASWGQVTDIRPEFLDQPL
ncbi:MAG: hypothetical protein Q8N23_08350 [Archangium sp.]|nr:hypothetical protein [Archangium sp.]MDP3152665.1 hypothetical protein [Archangium sp.]MDP3574801.1 hypothetical protein [Archangium sp.]